MKEYGILESGWIPLQEGNENLSHLQKPVTRHGQNQYVEHWWEKNTSFTAMTFFTSDCILGILNSSNYKWPILNICPKSILWVVLAYN